jgi:hypothetical protein
MQFESTTGNLVVTNEYVVNFLKMHHENKTVLRSCASALENYCKSLCDFIEHHNDSANSNTIIAYLKEMEARQEVYYAGVNDRLESSTAAIADKMCSQMSGLIMAINNMTETLYRRLDVDSMTREILGSLQNNFAGFSDVVVGRVNACIEPMKEIVENVCRDIHKMPDEFVKGLDVSEMARTLREWQDNQARVANHIREMEGAIVQHIQLAIEKQAEQKELSKAQQQHMLDQINHVPLLTKAAIGDALKELEQQSTCVATTLQATHQLLQSGMRDVGSIRADTAQISSRVDGLMMTSVKNSNSTKFKGADGEDKLYDLLCERLKARDGYVVERVSGHSFSCDIAIKREGQPTVRIESKAHGYGTQEKVRYKEVEKFQRDLLQANNHGIFVSLFSGIVGIGNVEVQQLPNSKFAVYLSNNHYDVETIIDMVQLLYKLDNIVCGAKDDGSHLRVTIEAMTRIKMCLQDYSKKINSVKAHMRDSIAILNEMQFDMIESVLMGQHREKENERKSRVDRDRKYDDGVEHICCKCGRAFLKKKGLATHFRNCRGGEIVEIAT